MFKSNVTHENAFKKALRGNDDMKKIIAVFVLLIIISVGGFAEDIESIIPDASLWGNSADNLIDENDTNCKKCQVGEDTGWCISNKLDICSYRMDVYYIFEKEKTGNGLYKIAYILNDSDNYSGTELNQCYQTLLEEMKKKEGEPSSEKKNSAMWKKDNYKIELGKGQLEKYTGSDNLTVGLIIKAAETYEELKVGSNGDAVIKLQNRLNKLGYSAGNADGDYGNKTKAAIEAFQSRNGLAVTGVADQETQKLLFSDKAKKPAPTPKPTPTPTPKPEYAKIDYKGVSRHPDNYEGKLVKFTGIVVQAQETYGIEYEGGSLFDQYYVLRVASKYKRYKYADGYDTDDIVYVVVPTSKVEGGRILEDDKVSVYGRYDGIETYEALLGNSVSIPRVEATKVVIK